MKAGRRLPSRDESVAPGTILDGEGRVIRVVPAAEFRRPQLPSRGTWRDRRRDKPPRQGRAMRYIVAAVGLGPLLVSAPAPGGGDAAAGSADHHAGAIARDDDRSRTTARGVHGETPARGPSTSDEAG